MNNYQKTISSAGADLADYFKIFKESTLGCEHKVKTEFGEFPMIYTDWIAEGRLYGPIEEKMKTLAPYVANPHSYSSYTGQIITALYNEARQLIKKHVNATDKDVLVMVGHGMTGAMERFLGIIKKKFNWTGAENGARPIVFTTHMEHHSNFTTWHQAGAEVIIVPPDEKGMVSPENLENLLKKHENRKLKIGSFSAASNVSGIMSDYHKMAAVMHRHKGYCFVDFAASAPYVNMNMHPEKEEEKLDAVFFAPHKFLGGPGTPGVVIFDQDLHPGEPCIIGGGNVKWAKPWGGYGVAPHPEAMEDAGTPAFLQTIKAALAISLKEEMGVEKIKARDKYLVEAVVKEFRENPDVELIACEHEVDKIGVVSFNIKGMHYNLVVRILNDRFGIQTRGGWSCASTYAQYIYGYDHDASEEMIKRVVGGNMTGKPGWVRLSLHPTMSNEDLDYCIKAIHTIIDKREEWGSQYEYNTTDNEYYRTVKAETPSLKGFFNF